MPALIPDLRKHHADFRHPALGGVFSQVLEEGLFNLWLPGIHCCLQVGQLAFAEGYIQRLFGGKECPLAVCDFPDVLCIHAISVTLVGDRADDMPRDAAQEDTAEDLVENLKKPDLP